MLGSSGPRGPPYIPFLYPNFPTPYLSKYPALPKQSELDPQISLKKGTSRTFCSLLVSFPGSLISLPFQSDLDLQISLEKGTSQTFSTIQEFLDRNKLYLSLIQEILQNILLPSCIFPWFINISPTVLRVPKLSSGT